MTVSKPQYGRRLEDFSRGDVYAHPWDVTIDDGMIGLFSASFQDAMPTFASKSYAESLGFSGRPVHPLLLLNLGLSFSVHDVSEQAIAHLAYIDVRFPAACYPGHTVSATSKVLDVKPSSKGDRGVVEVRTLLSNQRGEVVCRFDRRALVRAGSVNERPRASWPRPPEGEDDGADRPPPLRGGLKLPPRMAGFSGFFEDFQVGDVIVHGVGKTVGESEHMQLTQLCRNSHPIHFDEVYCKQHSFAKTRVVYGGLVLSWVLALASRDLAGNAVWDLGLDEGAHPNGVLAGDTLYATSKLIAKRDAGEGAGELTLRVIGTKNRSGAELANEPDFFRPELGKSEHKLADKVVEITRKLLVRKRPVSS
jgi:2-methylfumaryl-CoA hydratase